MSDLKFVERAGFDADDQAILELAYEKALERLAEKGPLNEGQKRRVARAIMGRASLGRLDAEKLATAVVAYVAA